jgi:hypothetical protein
MEYKKKIHSLVIEVNSLRAARGPSQPGSQGKQAGPDTGLVYTCCQQAQVKLRIERNRAPVTIIST